MSDDQNNKSNELIEKERKDREYQELKQRFIATYKQTPLETPCYRQTFLTSVPIALVSSLFTYLLTSKANYGGNAFFAVLTPVTFYYFYTCKKEFDQKMKDNEEAGKIMELAIRYRGTEMEAQLKERYKEKIMEMDKKSKYI